jgi:hypothetical protein
MKKLHNKSENKKQKKFRTKKKEKAGNWADRTTNWPSQSSPPAHPLPSFPFLFLFLPH